MIARGLAAHSILLSTVGVPAIYYHSLFGSAHDPAGMATNGIKRRINRQLLDADELIDELGTPGRRRAVFTGLVHQLSVRRTQPAFSPWAAQEVAADDPRVLVIRRAAGSEHEIFSVTNVTAVPVDVQALRGLDVLRGERHDRLRLPPYGHVWIRPDR